MGTAPRLSDTARQRMDWLSESQANGIPTAALRRMAPWRLACPVATSATQSSMPTSRVRVKASFLPSGDQETLEI
ncbi:hypothetical protein D3C86_1195800 [compost metagenome]